MFNRDVFEMKQEIGVQTITFSFYESFWFCTVFDDLHDMFRCALIVVVCHLVEGDGSFDASVHSIQFCCCAEMTGEIRSIGQ